MRSIFSKIMIIIALVGSISLKINGQTREPDYETLLNTLTNEALEAQYEKRYQTSIRKWNQCLAIYEQLGDSLNIATTKVNLAKLYSRVGDYPQAFLLLNEAQVIFRQMQADFEYLQALKITARIYFRIGNYFNAKNAFLKAHALASRLKATSEIIQLLTNLGQTYYQLGDEINARKHYYLALAQVQKSQAYWWEARLHAYLGILNYYESTLDSSLLHFQLAVEIQDSLKDKNGLKDSYFNLGVVYYSLDELGKASSNLNKALDIQKEINDLNGIIDTQLRLGDIAYQQYRFQLAEVWYNQAYESAQKAGHRLQQAECLKKLGFLEFSNNRFVSAREKLQQALTIALNINDPKLLWSIYQGLGLIAKGQNLMLEAFQNFQQAVGYIEISEPTKSLIVQPTEFVKSENDVYEEAIFAAWQSAIRSNDKKWLERIFNISESLHARQLHYELMTIPVSPAEKAVEEKIVLMKSYIRQYWAIQKLLIQEKTKELLEQNISRVITLRNYLNGIDQARQRLQDELFETFPRYQHLFAPRRPQLPQIQTSLKPFQLILKYILLKNQLLIMAIHKEDVGIYSVQISLRELLAQINRFYDNNRQMQNRGTNEERSRTSNEIASTLKYLGQILIKPVQTQILQFSELIILPEPTLSIIPFEALSLTDAQKKQRQIIDLVPVRYLNRAALVFDEQDNIERLPDKLLAIQSRSSPPLVTETSLRRMSSPWANYETLQNPSANQLTQTINAHQGFIHLGLSGQWNSRDPHNSFFYLTKNDANNEWFVDQWFKISNNLQNLVCCANFQIIPGLNVSGEASFVEMMRIINIRQLIFSRWRTPDEIQNEFFSMLYQYILAGAPIVKALQLTKQTFRDNNDYKHLFFWSGFVLYQ